MITMFNLAMVIALLALVVTIYAVRPWETKNDEITYKNTVKSFTLDKNNQNKDITKEDSGVVFRYTIDFVPGDFAARIVLPDPTGSGINYTFVCEKDMDFDPATDRQLGFRSENSMLITGTIGVVPRGVSKADTGTATAFFSGYPTSTGVLLDTARPDPNGKLLEKGSFLKFTDALSGMWVVEGTLITKEGLLATNAVTPFQDGLG